jgi:hypothetical protein
VEIKIFPDCPEGNSIIHFQFYEVDDIHIEIMAADIIACQYLLLLSCGHSDWRAHLDALDAVLVADEAAAIAVVSAGDAINKSWGG